VIYKFMKFEMKQLLRTCINVN